ncbi:MAG: aldose 1-epimerase family protein [Halothermotrichaceae bacterium]
MLKIGQKEYTKEEIRRYFGSLEQIAGIQRYNYSRGKAKGMSAIEVRNGTGFRFVVLPDRGMDIGLCEYKGIPINFRSPVGECSPAYYEPSVDNWFRSFMGGLLTTCGLTYLGSPCEDNGEKLGLHGRISNIPAEKISTETIWQDNNASFIIKGKVREAKTLSTNITLSRKITAVLGENKIIIDDIVTNEGFTKTPHMILYHFNIGHPILGKESILYTNSKKVLARDKIASSRNEAYSEYLSPTSSYPDTVYYHDLDTNNKYCYTALINNRLNIGVYLKYKKDNLPVFVQWKYTNEGNYVAGLEPANCHVEGRDREREKYSLIELSSGEQRNYQIEVGILKDKQEVNKFKNKFS